MTINVWLAVRDDAQTLIVERLRWDSETQDAYAGPVTDRQAKLFSYMQDRANRQGLYRTDNNAGKVWTLWSVDFDLPGNLLQQVKDELDQLVIDYPNHIVIGGAWRWSDGRQVVGYPPHPRLIEFMPDSVAYDQVGNETGRARPSTLSDINLGLGQAPRQF